MSTLANMYMMYACMFMFVLSLLQEKLGDQEVVYLQKLVYNGFFGFEMMTEQNINDAICGKCGIIPEICLGDGNEKNSEEVGQLLAKHHGKSQAAQSRNNF